LKIAACRPQCGIPTAYRQHFFRSARGLGPRRSSLLTRPWGQPSPHRLGGKAARVDMDLIGKAAIVTGGTKGIGRGIAEALVLAGIDVCISARRRSEIDET